MRRVEIGSARVTLSSKEDKGRTSKEWSPMEEHRQMIEKLMEMQFIVAGVVQDVVSKAVQNAENNKVKQEKVVMSSYSPSPLTPVSPPHPSPHSEALDSQLPPPDFKEAPDSPPHPLSLS